jgi:hypothetical protein
MTLIRLHSLPLVLLSVLAAACSAQATDGDSESNDALVNAPVDDTNTWAVGVCASKPNTDPAKGKLGACVEKGTRCTGSLVAPNLVLTARHCVHEIDWEGATGFCDAKFTTTPLTPDGARVTLGPSVLAENPPWINVREILTDTGTSACDDDIVLLVLDQNVPAAAAKPIKVDLRNLATTSPRPREVAIVGRGILTSLIDPHELAPIDEAEGDLKRRYAEHIPLECLSDQPNSCTVVDITSPPSNKFTLSAGTFQIGAGGASGDSGSSVLTQTSFHAGSPTTIGVFFASTFGENGVGNAGLVVRLNIHKNWIRTSARHAASVGGYAPADWAGATD